MQAVNKDTVHFHILANYLFLKNTIICLFSIYNLQGSWIKISFINQETTHFKLLSIQQSHH